MDRRDVITLRRESNTWTAAVCARCIRQRTLYIYTSVLIPWSIREKKSRQLPRSRWIRLDPVVMHRILSFESISSCVKGISLSIKREQERASQKEEALFALTHCASSLVEVYALFLSTALHSFSLYIKPTFLAIYFSWLCTMYIHSTAGLLLDTIMRRLEKKVDFRLSQTRDPDDCLIKILPAFLPYLFIPVTSFVSLPVLFHLQYITTTIALCALCDIKKTRCIRQFI